MNTTVSPHVSLHPAVANGVTQRTRRKQQVRQLCDETPDHILSMAVALLAETKFPELTVADESCEAIRNRSKAVFMELGERVAEIDCMAEHILLCNTQLVSDVPSRDLQPQIAQVASQCLQGAPEVSADAIDACHEPDRFLLREAIAESLVEQAVTAAHRLDHICCQEKERGWTGTVRMNESRTVAEITSGHTVTTDSIISECVSRRDERHERSVGVYVTRETETWTEERAYEIETVETHVEPRHVLVGVDVHPVYSQVVKPANVEALIKATPAWLAEEFALVTGHLHDYRVQTNELRRYRHVVRESTLKQHVKRRLNDRGRDRDAFFLTMSGGGLIGGALAGLLTASLCGTAAGVTAGAGVLVTGFTTAILLDPGITWGPHCLCSWLPKGMTPQRISPQELPDTRG